MRLYQLDAPRVVRSCRREDGGYTMEQDTLDVNAVTYADIMCVSHAHGCKFLKHTVFAYALVSRALGTSTKC